MTGVLDRSEAQVSWFTLQGAVVYQAFMEWQDARRKEELAQSTYLELCVVRVKLKKRRSHKRWRRGWEVRKAQSASRRQDEAKAQLHTDKASRLEEILQRIKTEKHCVAEKISVAEVAHKAALFQVQQTRAKFQSLRRIYAPVVIEMVGISSRYRSNTIVQLDRRGQTHIYFGAESKDPFGPGHGHYILCPCGAFRYKRDPGQSHGIHNVVQSPNGCVC